MHLVQFTRFPEHLQEGSGGSPQASAGVVTEQSVVAILSGPQ